jgi:hypothetical protein
MVTQHPIPASPASEVIYPDSDGNPMADNTLQFRWILVIEQNIDWLFAEDPNVFVAGDLLWYPIEGNNRFRIAPDTMVDQVIYSHRWSSSSGRGSKKASPSFPESRPGVRGCVDSWFKPRRK